jgi:hypothetical protein
VRVVVGGVVGDYGENGVGLHITITLIKYNMHK